MAHPPRRHRSLRRIAAIAAASVPLVLAPLAPAAAGMHDGPPVDTRTWSGEGRVLLAGDKVAAAGKPFNRFLTRTFAQLDGAPGDVTCAAVSSIELKRWRSDGYASLIMSAPCSGTAVPAVAVREDRRWSIPEGLSGRTPACLTLSSHSVPPAIHRGSCRVPNGTRVSYRDWFWNKVDDRGNPR